MKLMKKDLTELAITDSEGTECGKNTVQEFSEHVSRFYAKRGYSMEKELSDKQVTFLIRDGPVKRFEVVLNYIGSKRIEERQTGELLLYDVHQFSANFIGPISLAEKHRDAFFEEYYSRIVEDRTAHISGSN